MTANPPSDLELVDPEGDLILEVGDPNSCSLQDTSSKPEEQCKDHGQERDDNNSTDSDQEEPDAEKQAAKEDSKEKNTCGYVRILVCSKVLIWTSSAFRQMLNGSFAEAQQVPDAQGRRTLKLPEDDALSMLEICKLLHHKAGSRNKAYPYSRLHGLAVLCDKYDFKEALYAFFAEELDHALPGTGQEISSGFPSDAHTRSLEVMKMAYLVGIAAEFANATLVYAYVQHPDHLGSSLLKTFDDIPVPDGLLPRLYALQHILMKKYTTIPTDILAEITCDVLAVEQESVQDAILAGSGWTLCDGALKQLGIVAAFLTDRKLFGDMHTCSVQQYALHLKKQLCGSCSPGAGCYCNLRNCTSCRGMPRPDLMSLGQRKLQDAFASFWDRRICFMCVQENLPFKGYEEECTIHK